MNRGLIRGRDIIVDDVLDRIFKAWITHTIDDLSLQDRWILERMEYIDALLKEGGEGARYKNVVEFTYQAFKAHDITRRTIETDIARTKRFFLTTRPREDKEYAKGKYIEWGEKKLAQLDRERDHKEWNKLFKELGELQGFKDEDIDAPDYSLLQPPPLMVTTDAADIDVPVIDNLEEEMRILRIPKANKRNTDNIDDAEDISGVE